MKYRRMILLTLSLLFLIVPLYVTYQHFLKMMTISGVSKPNVVLITIDTLQCAATGPYGNNSVNTPFQDTLCKEGILFPRGYASIPTTGPSHTTMLTGRSPGTHRVFRNGMRYSNSYPTLAKVFMDMGYRTGAFVSGYSLTARMSGLDPGFQRYDDIWSEHQLERDAFDAVRSCAAWIRESDASEPFFVWLHLFDPHSPYQERYPYFTSFTGESDSSFQQPVATDEQSETYAKSVENALRQQDFMVLVNNPMTLQTDATTLSRQWAAYQSEVCYADAALIEFRRFLLAAGRWDRSLVIFTADHGEGFDHNYYFGHGDRLWESSIRVPWIVRFPLSKVKNTVAKAIARHEDIFPTAISIAGIKLPIQGLHGSDLKTTMELNLTGSTSSWIAVAPPLPRKGFSEGLLVAAYDFSHKLIRRVDTGDEVLFKVTHDFGETRNLADELPELRRRLSQMANRAMEQGRFPRTVEFEPEEVLEEEKLRSLGYIH